MPFQKWVGQKVGLRECALISESRCFKYFSKQGVKRESFENSVNYFEWTNQGKEHPAASGSSCPSFHPAIVNQGPGYRSNMCSCWLMGVRPAWPGQLMGTRTSWGASPSRSAAAVHPDQLER